MSSSGYRQVSERAATWISANLTQFNYSPNSNLSLTDQLKPLSELALTSEIMLFHRVGDALFEMKSREWFSYCWSQINEGDTLRKAIETRPDFLLFAAMYLPFRRNGMINKRLEQAVRDRLRIRWKSSQEFPGWTLLLFVRTLNVLDIESPWTIDSCFKDTWLHKMPAPWTIRDTSPYALTHTVFFLTDFGRQPENLSEKHRQYLALWLPVWMEHYRTAQNYDLLAEMIMMARCIQTEDENDWGSILLARQEKDGMIRGPEKHGINLKDGDENRKRFRDHYHKTLTALMASVMSLDVPSRAAVEGTVADPAS